MQTKEELKIANKLAVAKYRATNPNYKNVAKRSEEKRKEIKKETVKKYYCTIKGRAYSINNGAKHRSKKRNLDYDLTQQWVQDRLEKGVCEVTGLPFTFVTAETYGVQNNQQPFTPSIDRIDPKKGYTQDNCRVVCLIFNMCKHHWSDQDVQTFVNAFYNRGVI